MPYVKKAQSPLLRQFLLQKPRGMGQTDTSVYDSSLANTSIDTSGLPVGGLSPTDTSILGLSPVPTTTPSSSGLNLTNLLTGITNAAVAGQKIYLGLQTPALVAGTGAIYNAATGQFYDPQTGQVVSPTGAPSTSSTLFPAGLSNATLTPILMIGGLLIAGVVVVSMLRH